MGPKVAFSDISECHFFPFIPHQNSKIMKPLHHIIILLLSYFGLAFVASGQGDLLVTPTRIVFEDNERSKKLILINTGKDTATYVISWVHYFADENGKFHRTETPQHGQYFANEFIRFFPRKFTLPPNEPQTLRMQLRRSAAMPDGEYISHLYFRAENKNQYNKDAQLLASGNDGANPEFKIELIPIYGITIPVIVQHGEVNATTTIQELKLNPDNRTLNFVIQREGNISVNGNLKVFHHHPDGEVTLLKEMNSATVFAPNKFRRFSLRLGAPEIDLRQGYIELKYISRKPGEDVVYAYRTFELEM